MQFLHLTLLAFLSYIRYISILSIRQYYPFSNRSLCQPLLQVFRIKQNVADSHLD